MHELTSVHGMWCCTLGPFFNLQGTYLTSLVGGTNPEIEGTMTTCLSHLYGLVKYLFTCVDFCR